MFPRAAVFAVLEAVLTLKPGFAICWAFGVMDIGAAVRPASVSVPPTNLLKNFRVEVLAAFFSLCDEIVTHAPVVADFSAVRGEAAFADVVKAAGLVSA